MQDVPKIVRERLKAATGAVNHPDADMLTAFAERSLPELERAIVLEHLGRCGDCRDVVALAAPETETIMARSPARGPWLTWPAIRLAFVAAGFVAVAAIGIMQYQKRQPATMAYKQATRAEVPASAAPAVEARNESAPLPAVAAPVAEEGKKEKVQKDLDRLQAAPAASAPQNQGSGSGSGVGSAMGSHVEVPAVNSPRAFHGNLGGTIGAPIGGPKAPVQWQLKTNGLLGGPKAPVQWQQNTNGLQNQAPAPPPLTPSETANQGNASAGLDLKTAQTVEVSGAAPAIVTQEARLDQNLPAAPKASDEAVGKAKAPVTVETEAAAVQTTADAAAPQELPIERSGGVSGRNFAQLVTEQPMIRWTVTSAGGLQRSFDRGNTWQDVNVNAGAAGGSMSYAVTGKTARAKEKSADKKVATATLVFRAVTAIGAEVWAGGAGGALYHSSDGGSQWVRVVPSSGGIGLVGDIVAVEFSDAQHGKLTTSTGESWSTADTGQTWVKQ